MGGSCTAFCKKLGNSILEAILHENGVFGKRRQNLSRTSYVAGGDKHCAYETIAKAGGGSVFEKVQCLSKAFTLAEVLIVLGIIGLIADMTIPTLVSKTQDKIAVSKLKKAYSMLSQVTIMIKSDMGNIQDWIPEDTPEGQIQLARIYTQKMNIIRDCSEGEQKGCLAAKYKYLDGSDYIYMNDETQQAFLLNDGTALIFESKGPNGSTEFGKPGTKLEKIYGDIYIDINGPKKPNVLGQDVFSFWITEDTLIPYGTVNERTNTGFGFEKCNKSGSGHGCAAWVIYNENMDYLHCNDLSWGGKSKC